MSRIWRIYRCGAVGPIGDETAAAPHGRRKRPMPSLAHFDVAIFGSREETIARSPRRKPCANCHLRSAKSREAARRNRPTTDDAGLVTTGAFVCSAAKLAKSRSGERTSSPLGDVRIARTPTFRAFFERGPLHAVKSLFMDDHGWTCPSPSCSCACPSSSSWPSPSCSCPWASASPWPSWP